MKKLIIPAAVAVTTFVLGVVYNGVNGTAQKGTTTTVTVEQPTPTPAVTSTQVTSPSSAPVAGSNPQAVSNTPTGSTAPQTAASEPTATPAATPAPTPEVTPDPIPGDPIGTVYQTPGHPGNVTQIGN